MASREDSVYMAKLAEQAERYDEMVTYMKDVAKVSSDSWSPPPFLPSSFARYRPVISIDRCSLSLPISTSLQVLHMAQPIHTYSQAC
jgi:hypothetical protein